MCSTCIRYMDHYGRKKTLQERIVNKLTYFYGDKFFVSSNVLKVTYGDYMVLPHEGKRCAITLIKHIGSSK